MPMFTDPLTMARALGGTQAWYTIQAKADDVAEIYIYDSIGGWGISARDFVAELKKITAKRIVLRINTPGGSVFDGLAIYNSLKNHPAQVEVRIEGLAASMGSIIALAGDKVTIHEAAFVMIHNPWALAIGDADEMRKMADSLDQIAKPMRSIYARKTKKTEEEITKLMDEETWYSGAEAVEAGFADELVEEATTAAAAVRFDLSTFRHPPESYSDTTATWVTTGTTTGDLGWSTSSGTSTTGTTPAADPQPEPEAEPQAATDEAYIDPRQDDLNRRRLKLQQEKLPR